MKVEVRLFAYFRTNRQKKQILTLKEGATIQDVINLLGIDQEDISILLLNGRDGSADRKLSDGDVIAMFPPVGGG